MPLETKPYLKAFDSDVDISSGHDKLFGYFLSKRTLTAKKLVKIRKKTRIFGLSTCLGSWPRNLRSQQRPRPRSRLRTRPRSQSITKGNLTLEFEEYVKGKRINARSMRPRSRIAVILGTIYYKVRLYINASNQVVLRHMKGNIQVRAFQLLAGKSD